MGTGSTTRGGEDLKQMFDLVLSGILCDCRSESLGMLLEFATRSKRMRDSAISKGVSAALGHLAEAQAYVSGNKIQKQREEKK